LTEKDYDNASADYNSQMSQNVSIFNALKGISEDAKSEIEKAEDDARSSLQIVYNAIQSGGLSLKDITADQKALISKLETQSGLPVGFYQSLQNKNPKAEVVGTYNWTGADNKEYVSVLTKDPDTGEIKTNNVVLGTAKATGTGSAATTEELSVYYKQNMETELKKAAGADGFVSPTDWAKARKAWSANTPYDATKFDENFRGYVNPNDPQDYAGFEGYRKGFIKK
jgi:hypothetical protein